MSISIRLVVALLGGGLLGGCSSPCKHFSFREVSPGIMVGCRPTTQTDFDVLRKHGIRTILSLETFNYHVGPERKLAAQNGVTFVNVPLFASPLPPKEEHMKEALLTLSDTSLRPIYMHCLWGRDRGAILVGLYRMYYEDWPPEKAWNEVKRSGFKADWGLYGFKTYFWNHTQKPEWAKAPEPVKTVEPAKTSKSGLAQ